MDWIFRSALMLGFIVLAIKGYIKWEKTGWRRASFVCLCLMFPFAASLGEIWHQAYGTLPWLGGLEYSFAQEKGWGPAMLLLIIGLCVPWLTRQAVIRPMMWWHRKAETKPGIPTYGIATAILVISLYLVGVGGAYLNKAKGLTIGSNMVNRISLTGGDISDMASDITDEIAEQTSPKQKGP